MKFLYGGVLLCAAIVAVLFAISNRAEVAIGLWPLPDRMELPLFLLIIALLIFGFALGQFTAWVKARRRRREARERRRRVEALERELAATQARLAGNGSAYPPLLGARNRAGRTLPKNEREDEDLRA